MVDELTDLKPQLISDLRHNGFCVVDLGSGTFDIYVDLGKMKGCFIELKIANRNYKAWAGKTRKKGLNLTPQTQAIRSMKSLPIIFASDEDDINTCYLILSEELSHLSSERNKHEAILIGVSHLRRKSYSVAMKELIAYLRRYYSQS